MTVRRALPSRAMGSTKSLRVAVAVVAATVAASCSGGTTNDAGGRTTTTAAETGAARDSAARAPLERYADHRSANYDDPSRWLCRPGRDDVCSGDLDATVVEADGTLTVEPFVPAEDPDVDCFYVYPTISRDPGPNSDWEASDAEEGFAAVNQVARLRSSCRVFAPVYRQRTLAALASRLGGGGGEPGELDPFDDVLDAWRTYMARDNGGRGVVLVGHSQGSALLTSLVRDEIDPNPDVREILVAAYLVGSTVRVPEGADVGGDFEHVPLCRAADDVGCVVTWSSYRAGQPPPPGALFGTARSGDGRAACNSPAALAGGVAEVHSLFPADPDASILSALGSDAGGDGGWLDPAAGTVDTPFVSLPGLVTAGCATVGDFDYLEVRVHGDPSDPRADDIGGDLSPEWGLHLVDLNLVMGDVERLVARQARAWTSR